MFGLLVLAGIFGGPVIGFILASAVKAQYPHPNAFLQAITILAPPALFIGLMYLLIVNSPEVGMGLVVPYIATPFGALIALLVAARVISKANPRSPKETLPD
jgi:hypothetical protein